MAILVIVVLAVGVVFLVNAVHDQRHARRVRAQADELLAEAEDHLKRVRKVTTTNGSAT